MSEFPPYAFVPGKNPHPRRDPKGHSYGRPEPAAEPFPPEEWKKSAIYLRGIELFNNGYFWECHEMLEAIWHAVGHETPQGQFLQGIIQVAASYLHRSEELRDKGLARHKGLPNRYMGADVPKFAAEVRDRFPEPVQIELED